MKKAIALSAIASAAIACQPQAVPTAVRVAIAREAPTPQVAAPALTLLREHDMANLLQGRGYSESQEGLESLEVLNGFFGPTHYPLALMLLAVRRDSAQPLVYHVRGKSRFKNIVLPFAGTITLTQLLEQPHYSAQEVAIAQQERWRLTDIDQELYTAVGHFELREQAGLHGAGVYRGTVAFDFGIAENGKPDYAWRTDRTAAHNTQLEYAGTWTSSATKRQIEVLWAKELFNHPDVEALDMFTLGDRERTISPKYAKLGWSEYWQNDEWWADSPQPRLNL